MGTVLLLDERGAEADGGNAPDMSSAKFEYGSRDAVVGMDECLISGCAEGTLRPWLEPDGGPCLEGDWDACVPSSVPRRDDW